MSRILVQLCSVIDIPLYLILIFNMSMVLARIVKINKIRDRLQGIINTMI